MGKIIDFHTHTFAKAVVEKALDKLSRDANVMYNTDGTDEGLSRRDSADGISLSVVLPVATRTGQSQKINEKNVAKNAAVNDTGLIFFAAMHPKDEDIDKRLLAIKNAGFKGIKLHPVYQETFIDSKESLRLIDRAEELELVTVIHAGEDISFPGLDYAGVPRLIKMIDTVKPERVVLAHMGGYNEWDTVESDLAGAKVYLDTAFCINEIQRVDETRPSQHTKLTAEQFYKIARLHGAEQIIFGTDSPWAQGAGYVKDVRNTGLSEDELELVFYENARKLLRL